MDNSSLFKLSGLPDSFGVVLLSFSFILLLAPYFSGADFGLFKIPTFTQQAKKRLKIIGPVLFLVCAVSFIPMFPTKKQIVVSETKSDSSPSSIATTVPSPIVQPSPSIDRFEESANSKPPTIAEPYKSKVRDTSTNQNSNTQRKVELINQNVAQGSEVKHIRTQTWQKFKVIRENRNQSRV